MRTKNESCEFNSRDPTETFINSGIAEKVCYSPPPGSGVKTLPGSKRVFGRVSGGPERVKNESPESKTQVIFDLQSLQETFFFLLSFDDSARRGGIARENLANRIGFTLRVENAAIRDQRFGALRLCLLQLAGMAGALGRR